MSRFEEIKARREAFENHQSDDYECDGDSCCGNDDNQENWCKGRLADDPFWDHLEDDEAWLIAEVERLQRELGKFRECNKSNGCYDGDGNLHVHNGDFMTPQGAVDGHLYPRVARPVYHKEGE